jgi:hypothetical protein
LAAVVSILPPAQFGASVSAEDAEPDSVDEEQNAEDQ